VLKHLTEVARENVLNPEEQTAYVMHADNLGNAEKLKEMLSGAVNFRDVVIQDIGPVIGCHSGPGTLAVVFMGKEQR